MGKLKTLEEEAWRPLAARYYSRHMPVWAYNAISMAQNRQESHPMGITPADGAKQSVSNITQVYLWQLCVSAKFYCMSSYSSPW